MGFGVLRAWAARRFPEDFEKRQDVNTRAWTLGFTSEKFLQSSLVGTVAVRRIRLTCTERVPDKVTIHISADNTN